MNILSQNIKLVLKNKLMEIFSSFSDELATNIISSFSNNTMENKYISFVSNLEERSRSIMIKVIESTLEEYDLSYKESLFRRQQYLINKSNVPRTITTLFGDITFYRTYYQSRSDGSYHFLIDEELGLVSYDRYDPLVKGIAINNSVKTNQNLSGEITGSIIHPLKDLIRPESYSSIPRQSVFNWIKKWDIPNYIYPTRNTPDTLYIMADEKFIGCQNLDNDIMIKSFVSFEGVKTVSKNRRKLSNRLVYSTYSSKPWIGFVDWIYSIYDSKKVKNIYILSDGGNWIKAGIDELKVEPNQNIRRLLCEFHFKQAINRMTTDSLFRRIFNYSFTHDSKEMFVSYVDGLFSLTPNKTDTILKNKIYILNNYLDIKRMLDSEIGSSMESHISHCITPMFSSRPKGFSSQRIDDYIELNNFKNNNINIFNLYINSYNKKDFTINEEKLSYNVFDHSSNSLPALYSSYSNPSLHQCLSDLSQ